jgi:hypothetical protein
MLTRPGVSKGYGSARGSLPTSLEVLTLAATTSAPDPRIVPSGVVCKKENGSAHPNLNRRALLF